MTERVIGQRRETDHSVVVGPLADYDVPNVARGSPADVLRGGSEIAPLVQAEVESIDLVPGRAREGNENGSDEATIARNEDPHRLPLSLWKRVARGGETATRQLA